MNMIRTFQPIGQGAFYTEQFDNFTLVYDCGSDNEFLIKKEIKSVFEKGQDIDAVFISHLHSDHINGLEFLLEYCNVKRVFMPLLTENEKIHLLIQNEIFQKGSSPFLEELIEKQTIDNALVILVPETESDSQFNFEQESTQIDSSITTDSLKQNPKLSHNSISDWVFIPFNFRQFQRNAELLTELGKEKISWSNIPEFKKYWQDEVTRKKIIDIFKSIPGSMNTNSMTLYSGPETKGKHFHHHFIESVYFYPFYRHHHLAGCLYFGDYEATGNQKWTQFINHYKEYWENVGTVQIPHHGSKYNYNREINIENPKISIISSGIKNRHRHPHASTLKNILLDYGLPLIVSENVGSRIMIEIHGI
jgi:hypothetical protein